MGDRLVTTLSDGTTRDFNASEAGGLFGTARRIGLSPEAAGYYFPYCELLSTTVDACRSSSFYNISTVETGFSLIHPLLTTVILWPRQFPFGLVKNPAFARLQAGLVANASDFARRPLDSARPVFRFVHFSIPHLPYVFTESGYHPPFDPLRGRPDDQYVAQLRFVDRLIGELMEGFRRSEIFERTRIVLLADHGYRAGGRERDPLQIPFVLKDAGQRRRKDVEEGVRGERLLLDVVQNSCRSAS
jgi:hypothetical protein